MEKVGRLVGRDGGMRIGQKRRGKHLVLNFVMI